MGGSGSQWLMCSSLVLKNPASNIACARDLKKTPVYAAANEYPTEVALQLSYTVVGPLPRTAIGYINIKYPQYFTYFLCICV